MNNTDRHQNSAHKETISMIAITKENLEARLDEIDFELEELQDRITDLKRERDKVANRLDDLLDKKDR